MDVLHGDLVVAKIGVNREWNEYFHGGRSIVSKDLKQNKGVKGLFGEHKASTRALFLNWTDRGMVKAGC